MPKAIRKKCTSCGKMYGCHKGTPGDIGGICPECFGKTIMYERPPMPRMTREEPMVFSKNNDKKITIKTSGEATIIIE